MRSRSVTGVEHFRSLCAIVWTIGVAALVTGFPMAGVLYYSYPSGPKLLGVHVLVWIYAVGVFVTACSFPHVDRDYARAFALSVFKGGDLATYLPVHKRRVVSRE